MTERVRGLTKLKEQDALTKYLVTDYTDKEIYFVFKLSWVSMISYVFFLKERFSSVRRPLSRFPSALFLLNESTCDASKLQNVKYFLASCKKPYPGLFAKISES